MKYFITIFFFLFSIQTNAQQFNILLITETNGWHHESIGAGINAIQKLSEVHHFQLERQQQANPINYDRLRKFDAIIFLGTTGDIFNNEEQKAFEKFIQSGKGFVGIHSASDTEYDWNWYTQLVGHMFIIHPKIQTAQLDVVDKNFPGLESSPDKLLITDEWYELSKPKIKGLKYLVTVNEKSYNPIVDWGNKKGNGMGEFHPISWYHKFDGGRSFYTALGHVDKMYENHWFLQHLYGGIYYAATGKGIMLIRNINSIDDLLQ